MFGANGAGKSTILRAISGLNPPISGEIWFEGKRIERLWPPNIVRLGIGHVPKGRRLFPYMKVPENLKLGAFLRGNREEVAEALGNVFYHFPQSKERKSQQAGTLSGGEQEMLAIGRALMAKPKLVLLDEPSLGLAPMMVQEIAKIILAINQRGQGIVLGEQNAHMALRLAHKAYVIETGRVSLQGDAKDLLYHEHVKKSYLGG